MSLVGWTCFDTFLSMAVGSTNCWMRKTSESWTTYNQCSAILAESLAFNALMSHTRVNIENAFGFQRNLIAFLAFHQCMKLVWPEGGYTEDVQGCMYFHELCAFYGAQFVHQLGHSKHTLHMEIEMLLELCNNRAAACSTPWPAGTRFCKTNLLVYIRALQGDKYPLQT